MRCPDSRGAWAQQRSLEPLQKQEVNLHPHLPPLHGCRPMQQKQRSGRDKTAAAQAALRELSSMPRQDLEVPSSPPSPAEAAKQRHRQREAQVHRDAPVRIGCQLGTNSC